MKEIAGHQFEINSLGKRVCVCGIHWVQIASVTREDINKTGLAHVGTLLEREYLEIEAEVDRIWTHVHGVASSPNFEMAP